MLCFHVLACEGSVALKSVLVEKTGNFSKKVMLLHLRQHEVVVDPTVVGLSYDFFKLAEEFLHELFDGISESVCILVGRSKGVWLLNVVGFIG